MKIFFFCGLLMLTCTIVNAQAGAVLDPAATGKTINDTTTYDKVEFESEFPGGQAGWIKFLNTHLTYPEKAVRKKIQGTVVLQFIVEKDGSLSNIEALSGPELLQQAALDVIKQSPHWKPAFQNGKKVKSYKKQPITFRFQ